MWNKLKKTNPLHLFAGVVLLVVAIWIVTELTSRPAPRGPVDVIRSEPTQAEASDRAKWDSLGQIR